MGAGGGKLKKTGLFGVCFHRALEWLIVLGEWPSFNPGPKMAPIPSVFHDKGILPVFTSCAVRVLQRIPGPSGMSPFHFLLVVYLPFFDFNPRNFDDRLFFGYPWFSRWGQRRPINNNLLFTGQARPLRVEHDAAVIGFVTAGHVICILVVALTIDPGAARRGPIIFEHGKGGDQLAFLVGLSPMVTVLGEVAVDGFLPPEWGSKSVVGE